MTRIAILGCGPSGLVAAHALANERLDAEIVIWSKREKSPIWGAQYLHGPIPGVPLPDPTVIRYVWDGSAESYLRKVYGEAWDGTVSDECYTQAHLAWDIRTAYDRLWEKYSDYVMDVDFSPDNFVDFLDRAESDGVDLILNTLPRNVLCSNGGHSFKGTRIYAMGDSPEQKVPFRAPEGEILYNGQPDVGWYRASMIHGYATQEWPSHAKPPLSGAKLVTKPLAHNCNCWANSVVPIKHLGRMGKWQNGTLVHHVYPDTIEAYTLKAKGEI